MAVITNGALRGWACEACAWTFKLFPPHWLEPYTEQARQVVVAAFEQHACESWTSKDSPERDDWEDGLT